MGILTWFPMLVEMLPTFPMLTQSVWCWLWVFHTLPWLYWKIILLYTISFFFYHERLLYFIKCIRCIWWIQKIVAVLQFVNVMYHNYCFGYVEPSGWMAWNPLVCIWREYMHVMCSSENAGHGQLTKMCACKSFLRCLGPKYIIYIVRSQGGIQLFWVLVC